MFNYKVDSVNENVDDPNEVGRSQDQFKLIFTKTKIKKNVSIGNNPEQYFSSLEQVLTAGEIENKIQELKHFYLSSSSPSFKFYPSFSSSNLPQIFIDLLISKGENNLDYLLLVLKIIINLSSIDKYCESFPVDIIEILFDLFQEKNKSAPEISSISLKSIYNFSSSSQLFRDNIIQYILQILKYAQTTKKSEIKKNIFGLVYNMTQFEISLDQFNQIRNAILLLIDYNDESTLLIFTLTLRKLSYYTDIFTSFQDSRGSLILNFLTKNLTSSDNNIVYITLQIFNSIFEKHTFNSIPFILNISKFVESSSNFVVKYACLSLSTIIYQSPDALNENDSHIIVKNIVDVFIKGREPIKSYLLSCLYSFLKAHYELICDVDIPPFIDSLTKTLDSDNDLLLTELLRIMIIIISEEKKKNEDDPKPLLEYFYLDEAIELLDDLKNDISLDVSINANELSNILND